MTENIYTSSKTFRETILEQYPDKVHLTAHLLDGVVKMAQDIQSHVESDSARASIYKEWRMAVSAVINIVSVDDDKVESALEAIKRFTDGEFSA